MKICYFGSYQPNFSRNHILIAGLRQNHTHVIQCHSSSPWIFRRYPQLVGKFIKYHHHCTAIVVGVVGNYDVPLAWALGRIFRIPVIFDAFISLYDTYVNDRKICTPGSLQARWFWAIDKLSCLAADKIIVDTPEHRNFFMSTFHVSPKKFAIVPAGADDAIFKPGKHPTTSPKSSAKRKLVVEFHGMFTRLSGAEYFIQAAKYLEHHPRLEFWLIGESAHYHVPIQLLEKLKPQTLRYWPRVPVKKLAFLVSQADITVGHLGLTEKASRVISFKIYQGLSVKNAVIAPDVKAIKHVFSRETLLLTKPGNARSLSRKILLLANNKRLRNRIAKNGNELYRKQYTNKILAQKLLNTISVYG